MKDHFYSLVKYSLVILFLLFQSGCGGGSSPTNNTLAPVVTGFSTPVVNNSQGGFQSIGNNVVNSKENIQGVLNSAGVQSVTARYSVNAFKLEYLTRDANNMLVKVSGLLAIPNNKSTPSPIVSFQHGTIFTNAEAPSFHLNADESNPEVALASLGYIVFSADYIGYGTSFGNDHPYLQKEPSAHVVLDMLQAGLSWLRINNIQTNNQLFMTGYSQGGYVTMAALKSLQENPREGLIATGAVMGAGPYDLTTALDTLLQGINIPSGLSGVAIDLLERFIVPADAEITFDNTFLRRFFDGDRQDDVHNWRPDIPIQLFHGEDDRTVPIESAESTFSTMQALGADIKLTLCKEDPSSHSNCVIPYINFAINYFEGLRSD